MIIYTTINMPANKTGRWFNMLKYMGSSSKTILTQNKKICKF